LYKAEYEALWRERALRRSRTKKKPFLYVKDNELLEIASARAHRPPMIHDDLRTDDRALKLRLEKQS
jgi:hypothetical protein